MYACIEYQFCVYIYFIIDLVFGNDIPVILTPLLLGIVWQLLCFLVSSQKNTDEWDFFDYDFGWLDDVI